MPTIIIELQYVHPHCLQTWITEKGSKRCEICHQAYQVCFRSSSTMYNVVARDLAWNELQGVCRGHMYIHLLTQQRIQTVLLSLHNCRCMESL